MLLQSALISIGTASSSWKQKEFVCPDSIHHCDSSKTKEEQLMLEKTPTHFR